MLIIVYQLDNKRLSLSQFTLRGKGKERFRGQIHRIWAYNWSFAIPSLVLHEEFGKKWQKDH